MIQNVLVVQDGDWVVHSETCVHRHRLKPSSGKRVIDWLGLDIVVLIVRTVLFLFNSLWFTA